MSTAPQHNHTSKPMEELNAFARAYALRGLIFTILGGVAGILISLAVPKQWEAKSTLQIGQITYYGQNITTVALEDPTRAIERLRLPSTSYTTLRALDLPTDSSQSSDSALIVKSASVKQVRNTNFLELSVRGYTAEDARRFLASYQNALIQAHQNLLSPSIARFSEELAQVDRSLPVAVAQKAKLQSLTDEKIRSGAPGQIVDNVIIGERLAATDKEIRELSEKKQVLTEQLNPERSYNTRLLGTIEISRQPIFPSRTLFAIGGAVLGFALVLIWALLADLRQRARAKT